MNDTTTGVSPLTVGPQESGVCPHCGYCPHCGRAASAPFVVQPIPYQPMPWPWPTMPSETFTVPMSPPDPFTVTW